MPRRIPALRFLPPGDGLRLLAPLCAVPPLRGPLVLVLVTAGRRACSGTGFVVWWLLITHGFLPLRGYGAAPSSYGLRDARSAAARLTAKRAWESAAAWWVSESAWWESALVSASAWTCAWAWA